MMVPIYGMSPLCRIARGGELFGISELLPDEDFLRGSPSLGPVWNLRAR